MAIISNQGTACGIILTGDGYYVNTVVLSSSRFFWGPSESRTCIFRSLVLITAKYQCAFVIFIGKKTWSKPILSYINNHWINKEGLLVLPYRARDILLHALQPMKTNLVCHVFVDLYRFLLNAGYSRWTFAWSLFLKQSSSRRQLIYAVMIFSCK